MQENFPNTAAFTKEFSHVSRQSERALYVDYFITCFIAMDVTRVFYIEVEQCKQRYFSVVLVRVVRS